VAAAPLTSALLGREEDYGLLQNYPNPFNPTTSIPFSVARSGRVSLCVFSVGGQLVATLFDEWVEAGRPYAVDFSGASLSSGVYVSRLSSGPRTETRRMVLLK
jgi:hypothetical protein